MNETNLLQNMVIKWDDYDNGWIKYLWQVFGNLNTILTAVFQDEYILNTSFENKFHKLDPYILVA